MKKIYAVLFMAIGVTAISAEIKYDKYEVIPGNYFKHYGTKLDADISTTADKTITRNGLLHDGKLDYAPKTGICYVFWRVNKTESNVSFLVELPRAEKIGRVEIYGSNLSPIYRIDKAEVELGEDDISLEAAGKASINAEDAKKRPWKINVPVTCTAKAKFVRVTVWTQADSYLNVTEIKIFAKDDK